MFIPVKKGKKKTISFHSSQDIASQSHVYEVNQKLGDNFPAGHAYIL